jgi:UDP-3-O-[3-hydroxymyristoyl] glucosamine N-acyltransferase
MSEPMFFKGRVGLTVGEIAILTGATPCAGARLNDLITNVAPLNIACASDLAFLNTAKYADGLNSTQAGACLMEERFESHAPVGLNVLRTQEPYRDFVVVARKLFQDALRPSSMFEANGHEPTAVVHSSAQIGSGVTIDPCAVIGPRAAIGSGTVIGATAVIGPDVRIGRDCSIGHGASIIHTIIGDNVIIHPGCRIGQDGFRYIPSTDGPAKVPQLGRVIIHDNVEIGAGTAVDRGGSGDTVIGEGTKIDNLVQIAHNVIIGRHCIIAGQAGIAGSVTLGNRVMVGGQAAIADHLTIGDGARIGGKSGVMSNIPAGETWTGFPALPGLQFLRAMAKLRRIGK